MLHKQIHFVGIGGIGMSALARHYLAEGVSVTGSDVSESENTRKLAQEGATISYVQNGGLIIYDKTDMVVYTEAMSQNHPELLKARELGIKTINYFEALGEVANEYYVIAVSGTHGKTTTTAMLIDILEEASFDPTAIVGSLRSKTGSNYRRGKSKYFIVEACEYRRDFLHLKPDILVITNIEHEHVDYYKSFEDVQSAFHEFAMKVEEEGVVIANTGDSAVSVVLSGIKAQVIPYQKCVPLTLSLRQPGLHNRLNAGCAIAVAQFLGIEQETIETALTHFAGTSRRFEYKGDCNGALIYDDYAHHPTEIRASIAGARELYPKKKLTVVFQPHTHSRTEELFADFVKELKKADRVILMPVYAARSEEGYKKNSEDLKEALAQEGVVVDYILTHDACALFVSESVGVDDVVLVVGAGDVTKVAQKLIAKHTL